METEHTVSSFTQNNIKYYQTLNCDFWSTDHTIYRNYHIKKNFIQDLVIKCYSIDDNTTKNNNNCFTENENKNETEIQDLIKEKEIIVKSYEILITQSIKDKYNNFLFLNFIFCQPINLEILKRDFNYNIFPYYIFPIDSTKSNLKSNYLIIDFVKNLINFNKRENLTKGLSIEVINKIRIEKDKIIIKLSNKEKIYFQAMIPIQRDLIYVLLNFMKKVDFYSESNSNLKVDYNHFNFSNLKLLQDDSYTPQGIFLKGYIDKPHKHLSLVNDTRYMVLGKSCIILFTDEYMLNICNVIPIIPGNILFTFFEDKLKMKIKLAKRKFNIFFKNEADFQIWKNAINDLTAYSNREENIIDQLINNFLKIQIITNPNTNYTIYPNNNDTEKCDIFLSHLDDKIKSTEQTLKDLTTKREILFNTLKERKDKKKKIEKPLDDIMNNENFEEEQEKYMVNRMKRNIGSVSEAQTKKSSFKIDDISIIERGSSQMNISGLLDDSEITEKYLPRAYSAYRQSDKNKNK